MICLICRQTEIVDGLTTVHFERGEMRLVVASVPARVCSGCGEAYVEEDVAVRLLNHAKDKYQAGILDSALDFNAFQPTE